MKLPTSIPQSKKLLIIKYQNMFVAKTKYESLLNEYNSLKQELMAMTGITDDTVSPADLVQAVKQLTTDNSQAIAAIEADKQQLEQTITALNQEVETYQTQVDELSASNIALNQKISDLEKSPITDTAGGANADTDFDEPKPVTPDPNAEKLYKLSQVKSQI